MCRALVERAVADDRHAQGSADSSGASGTGSRRAGSAAIRASTAASICATTGRAGQASRIQRRHADRGVRDRGVPMAMAGRRDASARSLPRRRRPVQFAARAPDRRLAGDRQGPPAASRRHARARRKICGTLAYLQDCAHQAGLATSMMRDGGRSAGRRRVCSSTQKNVPIDLLFKLYPWEWMMREAFGRYLPGAATQFVEPPWKAILSNKGILPLLWAMFPRPSQPAAGLFRRRRKGGRARRVLCAQAALFARRRQHRAGGRRQCRRPDDPALTAPKGSCGRRSRRCRNSTATTPCSAPGSPPASPAGFRCARMRARSPRIPRAFCRTPSSDRWIAQIPVAISAPALSKHGEPHPGCPGLRIERP